MDCTLLVPRLFWPRETAEPVVSGLALPALTELLSRASKQRAGAESMEAWLSRAHGIERQHDWPIAPLTAERDGIAVDDAYWLRADPVHLRIERTGLTFGGTALLMLTEEESQALVASLNAHFEPVGLSFHAPAPERWYVKLAAAPGLTTRAPDDVVGADVPALGHGSVDVESVARKMILQRLHERLCFVCSEIEKRAIEEREPSALDLDMHRVGAQPVRAAGIAAVELERERRDRPVVLAFDFERLAEPAFGGDRGKALRAGACEQRRKGGKMEAARDGFGRLARPEQIGNQQRAVHLVLATSVLPPRLPATLEPSAVTARLTYGTLPTFRFCLRL